MDFYEAERVIRHVIDGLEEAEYDGLAVKRLEASNTLDEGRTTNQTHIAISGEQMNMFPHLMAEGYFQCDYLAKDEQLKKYFIMQIPIYIYKKNVDYLSAGDDSRIEFVNTSSICTKASIVRSRRKNQSDQVQLSLTTVDDAAFVCFRKLLHTGDYLVLLKHKEKLEYDCIGVRSSDQVEGNFRLSELNNKFYKLPTNTKVDLNRLVEIKNNQTENEELSLEELGIILKRMYDNAANKMQVASIHIFGIKYGKNILSKGYQSLKIVKRAGLNDSYSTELQKALNIYRCLQNNVYGISIVDDKKDDQEVDIQGENREIGGKNKLLYGVPGAGKSFEIDRIIDKERSERVVFHPDYTYSDFVGQILPRLIKSDENPDGKLQYVFEPGAFTKMLKKAYDDPENMYYLVIEELNRGNAPAIFGDIFQLLDRDDDGVGKYKISNYDIADNVFDDENEMIRIPSNLTILATMNTSDQNVFTLDTAFQRRWEMHLIRNDVKGAEHAEKQIEGSSISWGTFASVTNSEIIRFGEETGNSEDKRLGAYFARINELTKEKFPEKVLKYLWDDAFKMDHAVYFDESISSLDMVIDIFREDTSSPDILKRVLKYAVYSKMIEKIDSTTNEDSEVEGDEVDGE